MVKFTARLPRGFHRNHTAEEGIKQAFGDPAKARLLHTLALPYRHQGPRTLVATFNKDGNLEFEYAVYTPRKWAEHVSKMTGKKNMTLYDAYVNVCHTNVTYTKLPEYLRLRGIDIEAEDDTPNTGGIKKNVGKRKRVQFEEAPASADAAGAVAASAAVAGV